MTLKDYLKYVVHGGALSRTDAARCCELLFASEASHTDIAGLLCALHARGETVDELSGFLATMRSNMTRVSCNDPNAIDMCGTGGDGSHSFNLSTAASLLAAVAYCAVFVLLGQVTQRSLIWGVAYLLIFEQFISRGGKGLGFVAVHSHAVSVLSKTVGDVDIQLDYFSRPVAVGVALGFTVAWLVWSSVQQNRMSVA